MYRTKIITHLITIISIIFCRSLDSKIDKSLNIKQIRILKFTYEHKFGELIEIFDEESSKDNIYDRSGNLIESVPLKPSVGINHLLYIYSEDGKQLKHYYLDPYGNEITMFKPLYDSNNNMIEENYYLSNGEIDYKIKTEYDSNNNEIEKTHYNSDGSIYFKLTLSYDIDNNLVELLNHTNNKIYAHYNYKYDTNNNRIETFNKIDLGESLNSKELMKYNSENKLIQHTLLDSYGEVKEIFYNRYDSNQNLIKKYATDKNGNPKIFWGRYEYKYDKNNNQIEEIKYDDQDLIVYQYQYKYNPQNLLIEEKYFIGENKFGEHKQILIYKNTLEYDYYLR
tara:strand:+ start:439 stop:1452 length:1014 start_codon:yes stop_codon:yes gene_type:complete